MELQAANVSAANVSAANVSAANVSAVIVSDDEAPIKVDLSPPPLKKYRIQPEVYDEYDKQYATHMQSIKPNIVNSQPFDDFTDNLLADTHISRFRLLKAIADYKAEGLNEAYPLGTQFEDQAFNYRPHQNCTIS